jgi:WD40 repeat protein
MMAYDRVLVGPTEGDLDGALAEAAAAANRGFRARLLAWPGPDFAAFLRRWRAEAEGWQQWNAGDGRTRNYRDTTASGAAGAWWSDPLGRKHCRIAARRVRQGTADAVSLFCPWDERPPLWRTCPADVYLRQEAGAWRLWAACRCGAAGPPASLGWMGDCCGPCHDRRESGTPPPGDAPCPTVLAGHTFWVAGVAFRVDGRELLSCGQSDRALRLWGLRTGEQREQPVPRGLFVTASALAGDGSAAVFGLNTGSAVVVRVGADGEPTALTTGSTSALRQVCAVAFSPDGRLVAVAGDLGRLSVFEAAGPLRWRVAPGRFALGPIGLAFSPDGRLLAWAQQAPAVRLFDVATGREETPLGGREVASSVAFSPDSARLAAGSQIGPGALRLWSVADRRLIRGERLAVHAVAFAPDGRLLAAGGRDGALWLLDGLGGRLLAAYRWHQGDIDCLAFAPDGRWLATGGKDGLVKLWPVAALLA